MKRVFNASRGTKGPPRYCARMDKAEVFPYEVHGFESSYLLPTTPAGKHLWTAIPFLKMLCIAISLLTEE